jgi:hypothetical protein
LLAGKTESLSEPVQHIAGTLPAFFEFACVHAEHDAKRTDY